MSFNTVKEWAELLRTKQVSSVEIIQHYLAQIKMQKHLNCFITETGDQALVQAKAADVQRAAGQAGYLTGIPIAQKDIFCTEGVKTSCGSKMLDHFIAPYNAHIIERFNQAGMPMLGKLNMDEFAMGSSNENSFYGPVRNPWNPEYIPGGSSGGSSAVIAAGLAPAATGTDTGGSIRQPAAMTGITGLKPTYGRVSRFGMIAFASSLDQAGPMAHTAEDCALLLNVMAGRDERDSTSCDLPVPDYSALLNQPLKGLRIGLPKEFFNAEGLDSEVISAIQSALQEFEKLGAILVEISLPHSRYALESYYVIAPAECSSNLSRFDGVRYGYRCENPVNLEDLYSRSRGEGFGAEVKRRIIIGTYVLSSGYYDAYYLKAQKIRRLIANDFIAAFKEVDVIMGPTTPTPAFKLGEKKADPVSMYLSDIYTLPVSMAGLPGVSIPAGFISGLPIGLQIVGNYFKEAQILNVAHQFQLATDWHTQHPGGAQ
ncbi:MAG: Asp-tRNA(Asn)/Glu-tRNA(Gln) amidotransferase subunit GatA [Gammaproteobacteria bacterium]|nr:Asp-tRNA(Asn)/Glu-tRNA(Gln) amidotransferase subunit GatA [Gammaproteobacteria bacterium]